MDFPDKKTGRDQASRDSASDIISAIGRVFSEYVVLRGAFEEFSRSAAADMDPTAEMVYFAARNPDPRILVHLLKRNPGILSQNFTSIIDSRTAPLIEHVLVNVKEDGVLAVLGGGQLRDHLATTKFPLISLKSDLVENWHKSQDKVSATGPEKYATQEEAFVADFTSKDAAVRGFK